LVASHLQSPLIAHGAWHREAKLVFSRTSPKIEPAFSCGSTPIVVPKELTIEAGHKQGIPLKGPQRRDKSAEIVVTMSVSRKRINEPYR